MLLNESGLSYTDTQRLLNEGMNKEPDHKQLDWEYVMNHRFNSTTRRQFLASSVAIGTGLALSEFATGQESRGKQDSTNEVCCFEKPLQWMDYDQLAETVAKAGYDGIEATVRDGGHIPTERAEDELPKMVEALKKHGQQIQIMASSINDPDDPISEKALRVAAKLGVKRYRMKYFKYDLEQPIRPQVKEFTARLKSLAQLNADIGIQGVYQNHSGRNYFGAPIWDLEAALQNIDPQHLGIAFDIRHATVEGGYCWPLHYAMARPHIGIVYVKDYVWEGRKAKNVPLGKGQIDPQFFKVLKQNEYDGPISVHVEYHHAKDAEKNPGPVIADVKQDRETLRKLLN